MIAINCVGSRELPLSELIPFQGDLKSLSEKNYLKLKKQILEKGFCAPFFIWNNQILDGHARYNTLLQMQKEGSVLPDKFPVVDVKAKDEQAAKKMILAFSSQYNKMSEESLYEYINLVDLSFEDIETNFNFDSINLKHFNSNFFKDEIPTEEKQKDPKVCPNCQTVIQ